MNARDQAAAKVSAGVEPADTRGAATSPDEPGHVAPSGFSPGGCAAPAQIAGWRWYLSLGIFVGYAAGALTIGGFWWWGL